MSIRRKVLLTVLGVLVGTSGFAQGMGQDGGYAVAHVNSDRELTWEDVRDRIFGNQTRALGRGFHKKNCQGTGHPIITWGGQDMFSAAHCAGYLSFKYQGSCHSTMGPPQTPCN